MSLSYQEVETTFALLRGLSFFFFFFFFFFLRDFIFKKTLFEKLQYLKQVLYILPRHNWRRRNEAKDLPSSS